MEYTAPKSDCKICGSAFARKGMTRHIKSCLSKAIQPDSSKNAPKSIYLHISDAYNPDYFLHLLVLGRTELAELDAYLRKIWLECCGHLSAFSYERWGEEIDMRTKAAHIFRPGLSFFYQYDFGSTTELEIRCIEVYSGTLGKKSRRIKLLARNAQPIIPCSECGEHPAVQICTECQDEEGGWLCEKCAQTHECEEDLFLPVVNSPRTGVCAYGSD